MNDVAEPRRISAIFRDLTTPQVADACLRIGVELRCAPAELRALGASGCRIAGRVQPARHYGSVDVFLEAIEQAERGDVLVIDNAGRRDEACIGDLVALEASSAGLDGIVVWGLHRDTLELRHIGLPVFSLGTIPAGPVRFDEREPGALASARVGRWVVTNEDFAIGDEDGVIFVPLDHAQEIAIAARKIRDNERAQSAKLWRGMSLRTQLRFDDYHSRRAANPGLTFRQHLRQLGGSVEE